MFLPIQKRPPARTEAREDELEVLVLGHGVQLADEEHILGRREVGVGQVAQHLEHLGARGRCPRLERLLDLLGSTCGRRSPRREESDVVTDAVTDVVADVVADVVTDVVADAHAVRSQARRDGG